MNKIPLVICITLYVQKHRWRVMYRNMDNFRDHSTEENVLLSPSAAVHLLNPSLSCASLVQILIVSCPEDSIHNVSPSSSSLTSFQSPLPQFLWTLEWMINKSYWVLAWNNHLYLGLSLVMHLSSNLPTGKHEFALVNTVQTKRSWLPLKKLHHSLLH